MYKVFCWATVLSFFGFFSVNANADEIERKEFVPSAISRVVKIPSGYDTIYISGVTAGSDGTKIPANMGIAEQADVVYQKIGRYLNSINADFPDIVYMRVNVVEKDGAIDYKGLNEVYSKYFGTNSQPKKPARATIRVAGLGGNSLVEIEVIAAVKSK